MDIFNLSWGLTFVSGIAVGIGSCYVFNNLKPDKQNSHSQHKDDKQYSTGRVDEQLKLILGIRTDLKMGKGKVAAQCGHAAVAAYRRIGKVDPPVLKMWLKNGEAKIAVKVDSEEHMDILAKKAKKAGICVSVIHDAGHTQVEPDTKTVIAIGPASKSTLEPITGDLKLY